MCVHVISGQVKNDVLQKQNMQMENHFSGGSDIIKLIVMCCHYRWSVTFNWNYNQFSRSHFFSRRFFLFTFVRVK